MGTREQNERKFPEWDDRESGGRIYYLWVLGRFGWRARYCKEVSASEETIRFWQEIYNEDGKLVEIHQKFPTDNGHQKVD